MAIAEIGTNMSYEDMKAQAKERLEAANALESKYLGPTSPRMPAAEEEQVKKLLQEVDALEANLKYLDERKGNSQRIQEMLDRYNKPQYPRQVLQGDGRKAKSPGEQFTTDPQYLDLKNRNILGNSMNRIDFGVTMEEGTSLLEWKTLLFGSGSTSGGAWVANDIRPGAVDILQRELGLMDLIPRLQTSSDTIEYVKEDTYTNAAAFTPEATGHGSTGTDGRKPESALAFSVVTSPVKTLAHWLPVTNRMLADAPAIRGYINSRLLLGLQLVLEAMVISGDGTGENITGILNTSGINTMGKGADNEVDAVFKARTMTRTAGKLPPTAAVMNPADFQQVRLLRENVASATLGQYLMGPPNVLGPATIWGIPVVESENIAADTVLVGNFSMGATLFDREQSAIRVGLVNDQFIRNIQTILAEQRLAFVVWRPSAFTRVTGY